MKLFGLMLAVVLAGAVVHGLWFVLQPEPPCPQNVSRCEGGSAAPIYSLGVFSVLAMIAYAVLVVRRSMSSAWRVIGLVCLFSLAASAIIALVVVATAAAYMAGHPT